MIRTGIPPLRGDAPNLRLQGNVAEIQAIPIEIQNKILEYWIQQGHGSPADRIEDVPKEFRDRILQLFKRASAPHPDEAWLGLWEDLREKGEVPESIRNLQEFKNWFHNQDFDIDMSQRNRSGIMQAAYGGTARPTYTQSRNREWLMEVLQD